MSVADEETWRRSVLRGRNQQLLVDITSAGEHWTTKGDTA